MHQLTRRLHARCQNWMIKNMLKVNEDNTEVNNISIKASSEEIQPIDFIRNLGYFMDKALKNANHTNHKLAM